MASRNTPPSVVRRSADAATRRVGPAHRTICAESAVATCIGAFAASRAASSAARARSRPSAIAAEAGAGPSYARGVNAGRVMASIAPSERSTLRVRPVPALRASPPLDAPCIVGAKRCVTAARAPSRRTGTRTSAGS